VKIRAGSLIAVCIAWAVLLPGHAGAEDGRIELPAPSASGQFSVEQGIAKKSTVRDFAATPLSPAQVGQLLWAANGRLPGVDAMTAATRVYPSAGGLYPLEVFLVVGKDRVTGVPEGVYYYDWRSHSLKLINSGDKRTQLASACHQQMWLARAPALVVIGGIFERTTAKYQKRGERYVVMDAGSSCQNVYLQAAALGLHAGVVGAFVDEQVTAVLKLPAGVYPFLVVAVGQ
jgi:SagB-type dehydrogenase family enzyme